MVEAPQAAEDRATRVAIIGLGGSAHRILLPALRTLANVQVVAGCETNAALGKEMAKRWNIPRVYEAAQGMLEEERPDVAVVATPPLTHYDLCLLALERGCHVFCEKPFMASAQEAEEVIAAAQKANRRIAVNNQYYQMPIYREVKRSLEAGRLGRLYYIGAWQQMYLLPQDEGGWKAALQPRRVLYEFGTHVLDLICHFFQAYPVAVSARIPKVRSDVDADLCVVMRLDFPEERVATVILNRVSKAPKRYLEMRLECEKASVRTSLGGLARLGIEWDSVAARPRLRFDLTRGGEAWWEANGRSGKLIQQSRGALHTACAAHFSQFLSTVNDGAKSDVSAEHASQVLRIVFAGYESASLGGQLVKLC